MIQQLIKYLFYVNAYFLCILLKPFKICITKSVKLINSLCLTPFEFNKNTSFVQTSSKSKNIKSFDLKKNQIEQQEAINCLQNGTKHDVQKCIKILCSITANDLLDENFYEECIYYLAVAYNKVARYDLALICCDKLIARNPSNLKAKEIKLDIQIQAFKDGLTGLAILGDTFMNASSLFNSVLQKRKQFKETL